MRERRQCRDAAEKLGSSGLCLGRRCTSYATTWTSALPPMEEEFILQESLEGSSLSLQSSSIKTLQDGEAAAANSCTHCSVIGKEHSCTLSTLHADQNIVCRPDKGCFFFFSILQSLTRGKLCHSHGSETLESLTWPCLCQAIYIHSGIYLILHIHSLAPHTW